MDRALLLIWTDLLRKGKTDMKDTANIRGVAEFLREHSSRRPVSFHMPGHKGAALYRRFGYEMFMEDFFDYDITEIPGADNLFQPESVIAETMEKYRDLYDTAASYLLVNGTSGGLIASIMACVPSGGELILARNCHKSVFNALTLGQIRPVYAYPSVIEEYGIAGAVEPEEIRRLIGEHPNASAVILPSPNYYGICSDIRAIAEICHAAGIPLIVDQAHGAHLKFFEDQDAADHETAGSPDAAGAAGYGAAEADVPDAAGSAAAGPDGSAAPTLHMPLSAESCGADLVVNSTHKTLGSLTQSAVLNVCRGGVFAGAVGASGTAAAAADADGIDPEVLRRNLFLLEDKLQAIESTSPSYILMGSLDINADILAEHRELLFDEWRRNLTRFYEEAAQIPGLRLMQPDPDASGAMDLTKINLDMSDCGLSGAQLEQQLLEQGIYAELTTGDILMCMTGIGNARGDYERLIRALADISAKAGQFRDGTLAGVSPEEDGAAAAFDSPEGGAFLWTKKRQLAEIPKEKELIHLEQCAGRICASSIIPYPPGIPLICPGEVIGAEEIDYIKALRAAGEKVIGLDAAGRIAVGK